MAVHANHSPAALETALVAARALYAAAEALSANRPGRDTAQGTATALWLGPHRDTFDGLYDDENSKSIATETALKAEAAEWAVFWQTCTNLRNESIYNAQSWAWELMESNRDEETQISPRPTREPDVALPTGPNFSTGGDVMFW